jgi:hypothetical protein
VDRAVQGAVAATVKPVPLRAAAAGLERVGAGQRGERGLAAAPPDMGEAHDRLRGGDRADSTAVGQPRHELIDDLP